MIIPIPIDKEDEPHHYAPNTEERDRWIRWYVDCKPWKCHKCGATMFGRMEYCGYCKVRLNTDTKRPDWYVENRYDEDGRYSC